MTILRWGWLERHPHHEVMKMKLRAAKIAIEDDHPPLDCFVTGQSWNGWECPYFTKEQGDALLADPHFSEGRFDDERDAFVFPCGSCGGDCDCGDEVYSAVDFDGVKYYPIGAGMWIWSLAGEEDEDGEYIEPEDPWAGDFSRGAWHALWAMSSAMWGTLHPSHPVLGRILPNCVEEDESVLRKLFSDCLHAGHEYGIPFGQRLREDAEVAAAGGNPWAV
jgi:hypothetical protein